MRHAGFQAVMFLELTLCLSTRKIGGHVVFTGRAFWGPDGPKSCFFHELLAVVASCPSANYLGPGKCFLTLRFLEIFNTYIIYLFTYLLERGRETHTRCGIGEEE